MTDRTITVDIRSIYGREAIYPACPVAETIAKLAKTKTITRADLELAKLLGFEVRVKQKEL